MRGSGFSPWLKFPLRTLQISQVRNHGGSLPQTGPTRQIFEDCKWFCLHPRTRSPTLHCTPRSDLVPRYEPKPSHIQQLDFLVLMKALHALSNLRACEFFVFSFSPSQSGNVVLPRSDAACRQHVTEMCQSGKSPFFYHNSLLRAGRNL